ncbi:MAG TPA: hypothetical protein VNX29_16110 [Kaistia sp.]|nr:hypothetical protein [Kaistia sp.]
MELLRSLFDQVGWIVGTHRVRGARRREPHRRVALDDLVTAGDRPSHPRREPCILDHGRAQPAVADRVAQPVDMLVSEAEDNSEPGCDVTAAEPLGKSSLHLAIVTMPLLVVRTALAARPDFFAPEPCKRSLGLCRFGLSSGV